MRIFKQVCVVVAVVFAMVSVTSSSAQAAGKIETLLNELGVPSADVGDGVRKAMVELDGKTETVLLREIQLGSDASKEGLRLIQTLIVLVRMPEDTKPSAAAMNKLNELNVNLSFGKVSVWPGAVVYASTMWYPGATADTFGSEIVISAINAGSAREALTPFFKEE